MAYGFLVKNDANETVINDSEPLYVSKRSGTLSNSGQTNLSGTYKFFNSGNSVASGREIVLFSCGVGGWITFNLPVNPSYLGDMCSNQSSISYEVFGPRDELPNPTGYDLAVYNNAGNCVWNGASTITRIVNAGVIPSSQNVSKTFQTGSISGSNAVYCAAGSAILDLDVGYYQMAARRTGTTSWLFEQRRITIENTTFPTGDFTFTSDFSYILGVI